MTDTDTDALDKLAESLPSKHREARLKFAELPDGRKVRDLSGAELGHALHKLNIPDSGPSKSFEENKRAYESHLESIADTAADVAVLCWFIENEHSGADRDSEEDED